MITPFIFIILFILDVISQRLFKKFILLPYNSPLCNTSSNELNKLYDSTVNQQLNFETNSNISSVLTNLQSFNTSDSLSYFPWTQMDNGEPHYYTCRILVKPIGRSLKLHTEKGEYSFWNIRVRINRMIDSTDCSDNLFLQFRHENNLITSLDSHSIKIINITCKDSLPVIIPSDIRKLYITYFSSDPASPGFVINVTSFIYFQGKFSVAMQQDLCRGQDGFWCGVNNTNVCIFRELKCDGSDSCFDGGSDELNCPPQSSNNFYTFNKLNNSISKYQKTTFIDYLPWLALGILPLILLMALVCICNQHRSEVFFDDEDDNLDNLDIDKSLDENDHVWSSMDGIDQFNKNNDFMDDDNDDGTGKINDGNSEDDDNNHCDDHSLSLAIIKEPLIGLPTIHYANSTVKADITTSCTDNSLKGYEDIDKSMAMTKNDNGLNEFVNGQIKSGTTEMGMENLFLPAELHVTTTAANIVSNTMTISQITDDDYVLEDVGSLLRKVDKSKIPEEIRINSIKSTLSENETPKAPPSYDNVMDYRSDYILV